MTKIVSVILASIGLTFVSVSHAEHNEAHKDEIKITNPDTHNSTLQTCIKTALQKHPGAIMEVEVESEEGKTIIDVDIQGNDGKSWEIECDALTGEVLEDKEETDDKEETEK